MRILIAAALTAALLGSAQAQEKNYTVTLTASEVALIGQLLGQTAAVKLTNSLIAQVNKKPEAKKQDRHPQKPKAARPKPPAPKPTPQPNQGITP